MAEKPVGDPVEGASELVSPESYIVQTELLHLKC